MDKFIEQLRTVKSHEWQLVLLVFIGLVAPGILIIWAKSPDYIQSLSTVKLLLLSISLTAIPTVVNYYLVSNFVSVEDDVQDHKNVIDIVVSFLLFGFSSFLAIGVNLFMSINLPVFILLIISVNSLLVFMLAKGNNKKS